MFSIPKVDVPEGNSGPWSVKRFTVVPNARGLFSFALKGRPIPPGEYTQLIHERRGCVMSDTPAEMSDHYDFVQQAKGNVLLNGLGIGMALNAILKNKNEGRQVERITVVEIDRDVIDLVGPHYGVDPRVEIVHASAFDYQPPKNMRYHAVWHDIWDFICPDNLVEMAALHRKYGRRTDWQGSWCRAECLAGRSRMYG
jgi:hypothetical protein